MFTSILFKWVCDKMEIFCNKKREKPSGKAHRGKLVLMCDAKK